MMWRLTGALAKGPSPSAETDTMSMTGTDPRKHALSDNDSDTSKRPRIPELGTLGTREKGQSKKAVQIRKPRPRMKHLSDDIIRKNGFAI